MAFVLRRIIAPTLQRHLMAATTTTATTATTIVPKQNIYTSLRRNDAKDAVTNAAPATPSSDEQKLLISDSCIKRLREICQDGSFLRITVEGGGCSGFQYKFDLDSKLNEDDLEFGDGKAKVVIDNVSLEYCGGATIDYHTELIRSGFRMVANPKAEQGCSCGASFAIKFD